MKCPLCGAALEEQPEESCLRCPRCRTRARFQGEELEAVDIPSYHLRLMELERLNRQLTAEIDEEGRKGGNRDPGRLQGLHLQRQRVLSEYSFLSFFSAYQERWGAGA